MADDATKSIPVWLTRIPPFSPLAGTARFVTVLLSELPPSISEFMTTAELARMRLMSEKRATEFAGVRLGCKFLCRSGWTDGTSIPGWAGIETVSAFDFRPVCPTVPGLAPLVCSAAHDREYAFVAVDQGPVGVDVEMIDGRALRGASRFLSSDELRLLPPDETTAGMVATRLWTVKESCTKLLALDLVEGWRSIRVIETGHGVTRATGPDGPITVLHSQHSGHIFSISFRERDRA